MTHLPASLAERGPYKLALLATAASALGSGEAAAAQEQPESARSAVVAAHQNTVNDGNVFRPLQFASAPVESLQGLSSVGKVVISSSKANKAMVSVSDIKGKTAPGVPNTAAICEDDVLIDNPNDSKLFNLDSSGRTEISCNPTILFVNGFKRSEPLSKRGPHNGNGRIAIGVTTGHCTFVDLDKRRVTRIAKMNSEGECPKMPDLGIKPNRAKTRISAGYSQSPIKLGQSYTYGHAVRKTNGKVMRPADCAGDVMIYHLPYEGRPKRLDPGRSYPLKYDPKKGACTFEQQVLPKFSKRLPPKKERMEMVFPGNSTVKSSKVIISNIRRR